MLTQRPFFSLKFKFVKTFKHEDSYYLYTKWIDGKENM